MWASLLAFLKALPTLVALFAEVIKIGKSLTAAIIEMAENQIEKEVRDDLQKGLKSASEAKTVEEKRARLKKIRDELQGK